MERHPYLRAAVPVVLPALLGACATAVTLPPLPECHPASDAASSAPFARPSGVLETAAPMPSTEPRAPGAHEHQPETTSGHESHAPVHSCPMHPEVRSGEPGTCPICGMALEEVEPEGEGEPGDEGHAHHDGPPGDEP